MLASAPHFLPQHSINGTPPPHPPQPTCSSDGDGPLAAEKPPAATTGSPGTAIFLPPPAQSARHLSSSPQPSATPYLTQPRPLSPTSTAQADRIPVQWSFESSYGLFGSFGSAAVPTGNAQRHHGESIGLGSGWFGKKKEKEKDAKAKGKGLVRMDRAKSVDAPLTRAVPPSASPKPLRVATPPSPTPPAPPSVASPSPSASTSLPPARPVRSPLRPLAAHGTSIPSAAHSARDPVKRPSTDRISFPSAPPHPDVISLPLHAIPASNVPSPRASRSPSPVSHSHPPPSFRPTSAHRPGSSAGFKATQHNSPTASPPNPWLSKTLDTQRRRPATSSGIPRSHTQADPKMSLSEGLDVFNASTPSVSATACESITSLALCPTFTPSPLVPSKETGAQAAKKRRKENLEQGFVMKGGKRHHPRPKEVAPYPRNYERKVIDQ